MCTVTLHRTDASLRVTMNRDEARSRGPEIPPRFHEEASGTVWIAPRDSDHGGTWFAVNNYGLVAALLNRYQDDDPATRSEEPLSRGDIIPMLMTATSARTAQAMLESGEPSLAKYPPFTLVIAAPDASVRVDWRGLPPPVTAPIGHPWHLVTSSFFEPESVLPWRQETFDAWIQSGAGTTRGLPTFHLHQPPGEETRAPMMSRDISCTRSIVQASVDLRSGQGTLRYTPVDDATPDWKQFNVAHVLRRRPTKCVR